MSLFLTMIKKIVKLFTKPIRSFVYYILHPIRKISDILLNNELKRFIENPKNPLNKFGKRCFSQCDEDGITLEIVKRLKLTKGIFLEIGCDDGTQNNTLILAANKWKGIWIDMKNLAFEYKKSKKLVFFKKFVTDTNIMELINLGLAKLNEANIDSVSIDIDGADYFIVKKMLEQNIKPKFFIVEVKQQFPPPIEFIAKNNTLYDGPYCGASLTSFNNLFNKFGYTLICISSIMGHNAFFLKNDYLKYFQDVPKDIEDIYIIPNYWSFSVNFATGSSVRVVEQIFNEEN